MTSVLFRLSALVAALAACAACASNGARPQPAPAPTALPADASAAPAEVGDTAAPAAPAAAQSPAAPVELAVFRDEGFRRRFAESYAAESDVEPRLTAAERDTMQQVLDALAAEKPDEAIVLLQQARGDAGSAVFDFTLANVHFQGDRLDEAGVHYQAAVDKFARFRRAWRNLGIVRVRQNDLAGAVTALTRQIELGGDDAVTYGLLGFAHAGTGNSIAAESAYRTAAMLDPATVDWRTGLARALAQQRRYADAVAQCGQLVEQFPDRADLWLLQANALLGLDRPREAAQNLEMVDRLGQSTVESLSLLGDVYVNEQLYDLASDCYVRALEREAEGRVARALRAAKVLAARGAVDETRAVLDAVQRRHGPALRPDDRKDVLKLEARLAVARGAGDEEAKLLEQIVALDPLDGDALLLLGQHAQRVGDTDKAVFWYERAASLEAFEPDAKVRHAQLLVGKGRYAEALPLLRRAQSLKPRENVQKYLDQVERAAQAR